MLLRTKFVHERVCCHEFGEREWMEQEVRMTVRLPASAVEFLDSEAKKEFTSRNAQIVRSIRERMQMTAGQGLRNQPAVIEQNGALQGSIPTNG